MISWFDQPYKVRYHDGLEYLLQGVFLRGQLSQAILINGDGEYVVVLLTDLRTGFRYDHKARQWIGEDDDPTTD